MQVRAEFSCKYGCCCYRHAGPASSNCLPTWPSMNLAGTLTFLHLCCPRLFEIWSQAHNETLIPFQSTLLWGYTGQAAAYRLLFRCYHNIFQGETQRTCSKNIHKCKYNRNAKLPKTPEWNHLGVTALHTWHMHYSKSTFQSNCGSLMKFKSQALFTSFLSPYQPYLGCQVQ